MEIIYTGWPTLKLAPDLGVDTDPSSRSFGWLFAKHPDGQWVTLADLKPLLALRLKAAVTQQPRRETTSPAVADRLDGLGNQTELATASTEALPCDHTFANHISKQLRSSVRCGICKDIISETVTSLDGEITINLKKD